jgi:competence protein ComEC
VSDDDLELSIFSPDVIKPFASVRAVTTENRFEQRFGFLPEEGDWVELHIMPRISTDEIIAFHAQLMPDGYVEHSRGVLAQARLLFRREEIPKMPHSLSAAVAPMKKKAAKVAILCQFPSGAVGSLAKLRNILKDFSRVASIKVRDVGQASFVTLVDAKGECLGHFDAGWPISYNAHTAPTRPPVITGTAPVILSHWDWDHLHGYYKCPMLKSVNWLTPVQTMGPGASKIVQQLHEKGLLVGYNRSSHLVEGGATLLPCTGPARLNDNGLSLALTLDSKKTALLVGDAGYDALGPWLTGKAFDYLVVTHHGADFTGAVPASVAGTSRGIVSVGYKNVYKHPRSTATRSHQHAGWSLEQTSKTSTTSRGDRVLS